MRLVNGTAEVQLDGRTIQPGHITVAPGKHQLAALVDGDVVALADTPVQGGHVDLVAHLRRHDPNGVLIGHGEGRVDRR